MKAKESKINVRIKKKANERIEKEIKANWVNKMNNRIERSKGER